LVIFATFSSVSFVHVIQHDNTCESTASDQARELRNKLTYSIILGILLSTGAAHGIAYNLQCGTHRKEEQMKNRLLLTLIATVIPQLLFAQLTQQGPKLVGSGAVGDVIYQGTSVAISSDGNTAITGGKDDNNGTGAVWVFSRGAGGWTQQGQKLVGTDAVGRSNQGISVALSSDGNTAVVGGSGDSGNTGAIWVFSRTGGVWTQQGQKLVGSGAASGAYQGSSISLSSDGNTLVEGGWGDVNMGSVTGAIWVFTRANGVWSQQGAKLVGSGSVANYPVYQGYSVAISSDGTTIADGAEADDTCKGAIWIFTRSGNLWTQQGAKLVGTVSVGESCQGTSIAISSDGNTVIEGGSQDDSLKGAVWVFTRSGNVWTQQGQKLVGSDFVGGPVQGSSVAISSDGNAAIVGGNYDYSALGAVWVFTRVNGVWTQKGSKVTVSDFEGNPNLGVSVAVSHEGTVIVGGATDYYGLGASWIFYDPDLGAAPVPGYEPRASRLLQNYPNPFNQSSKITFGVQEPSFAMIRVYDIRGREISTLVKGQFEPGTYSLVFDGSNFPSGVYTYRLESRQAGFSTGALTETKQMWLLK